MLLLVEVAMAGNIYAGRVAGADVLRSRVDAGWLSAKSGRRAQGWKM